jgi:hypothetical protein
VSTFNDARAKVIKECADRFRTTSDADAKCTAQKMFDYESRVAELRKKYFKSFNKALPALTVVKFFQLENQLDLQIDL